MRILKLCKVNTFLVGLMMMTILLCCSSHVQATTLSTITGTISLPTGSTAPSGGISGTIDLNDQTGNGISRVGFYIPSESNQATYSIGNIPANASGSGYKVSYMLNNTAANTYVNQGFYSSKSASFFNYSNSTLVDVSSGDASGINMTLSTGNSISGIISLPGSDTAPEGGIRIGVFIGNSITGGINNFFTILQGAHSVSYNIVAPINTAGDGYYLMYDLQSSNSSYVMTGTYSGTIDVSTKSVSGINIQLIYTGQAQATALSLPVATLANGTVGTTYTASISATGGTSPYSYALASGSSLPAGLTLGTAGTISGTPTASGTMSFTVNVTDSATPTAGTASQTFSITVNPASTTVNAIDTIKTVAIKGTFNDVYYKVYLLSGVTNSDVTSVTVTDGINTTALPYNATGGDYEKDVFFTGTGQTPVSFVLTTVAGTQTLSTTTSGVIATSVMATPSLITYQNSAGQYVVCNYLSALNNAPMETALINALSSNELADLPIFINVSNGSVINYEAAVGKGENYATALTDPAVNVATAPLATYQMNADGTTTIMSLPPTNQNEFSYTITNGQAQITGYTGAGGAVTIPSTLGIYHVTSIGDWAFGLCTSLTSISIPQGVTSIGYDAFYDCTGLTGIIIIPQGITSIGQAAFWGCTGLTSIAVDVNNLNYESINGVLFNKAGTTLIECPGGITSISIPQGVTSIGDSAFDACTGLTSISIPQGVTSIGDYAFDYCYGLTSITVAIENLNYESIDGVLFNKAGTSLIACPGGIISISIPQGVTRIGEGAFDNCTGLTNISIPQSVTSIGEGAFYYCNSLTSISIPQGVTSIGDYAFENCYGLTSITFNSAATAIYDSADTIPATTTIIGYDPSTAKDFATKYGRTFEVIVPAAPTTETLTVSNPATTGFTVALSPSLAGLTKESFTLMDGSTPVTIGSASTTDNGSTYTIAATLTAGKTYTVTATDTGYTFGTAQNLVVPAASAPTTYAVSGVISNANGPLVGAIVSAGSGNSTTTGTDGTYTLNLSTGEFTLTVSKTGYQTGTISGTVKGTAVPNENLTLSAAASSDASLATVAGQVITAGGQAGTIAAPKLASINVANGVATVAAADVVKTDVGATVAFYGTDSTCTNTASAPINLTVSAPNVIYIKVTAADTTVLYYAVTINRAVATSAATAIPVITGTPTAGDTSVSGTAVVGASISISIGGTTYTGTASGTGAWSITVPALISGNIITITALATGDTVSNAASATVAAPSTQVTLSSIAVTTPATKLNYTVGDTLDLTGLVVTGTNSDNSTTPETITATNVTGFDSSVAVANQTLTITIGGKTTTYTVTIQAAQSYVVGDVDGNGAFDLTDYGYMKLYLLGKISSFPASYGMQSGKVCSDGTSTPDLADYGYMKLMLLGKISKFPIQ